MDGLQLEKLYVAIEAQTAEFNKQMAAVNNKIETISTTTKTASDKASKNFSKLGKTLIAVFSVKAIIGFGKKLLEMTKLTEDFKKTLAASLQPLTVAIKPALEALINIVSRTINFFVGLYYAVRFGSKAMEEYNKDVAAAAKANKTFKGTLAGFDELNTVGENTSDAGAAIPDLSSQVQAGADFWIEYGKAISDVLLVLTAVSSIILVIAAGLYIFNTVGGWVAALGTFIMTSWGEAYLVLSQGATATNLLTSAFVFMQGTLAGMLTTIAAVIVAFIAVGAAIYQLWNETSARGIEFKENLTAAFQGIIDTALLLWSYIQPVFDTFMKSAIMVWEYGLKPLWDGFVELVAAVVGLISVLWLQWLKPLVDFLIKVFGPIFQVIFSAIGGVIGVLATIVLNVASVLLKAFSGLIKFISGALKGGWESAFKSMANWFIWLVNLVISGINMMINGFLAPINGLIKGWNDTVGGLVGKIPQIKISIPLIPYLAKGGSLDAGSLFVAGEAGAEMVGNYNGKTTVMPLENTSFVAAMKAAMVEGLTEAMGGQTGSVVINVDGMTLAKSVESNLNKLSLAKGGLDIAL